MPLRFGACTSLKGPFERRLLSSLPGPSDVAPLALPLVVPLEEERLPFYQPRQYYLVRIGDIFIDRYRVEGKLGYGAYSTTWLCRDLHTCKLVVVKVSTSLQDLPTATYRELKIYQRLAKVRSSHPGQSMIREMYDAFELLGFSGRHQCLVLQPMNMSLLQMMAPIRKPFDLPLLKMTLRRLLSALDFLHSEAAIVHTDIKTDNIMLSLDDDTVLTDFVKAEAQDPSPRKVVDSSTIIYKSRRFHSPSWGKSYGLPILCDFGEARIGNTHFSGPFVQPHIYRAPEVIFEMAWGSAIDIWNLACLIWDLFEGQHLFGDIFDAKGGHDPFRHLALMAALIGPPPSDFVRRSETTSQCFDPDGTWIAHEDALVPAISLDSLEQRLSGQERARFIQFLRSMLSWLPEERKTAKELLQDPWLL